MSALVGVYLILWC